MKQAAIVAGALAALASTAWAGGSAGSHVHAVGNVNAGATVVTASQMQTGFLYAQSGGSVKGHIHLHGSTGNHVHIKFDSSNNFGSGAAFGTAVVGGYTVIARSVFTYNSAASLTVSSQQNFALGTSWGTYLCGPVFVSAWTQASGSFNGQIGLSLTAVAAGAASTSTVVNSFGSAGVSAGAFSGVLVSSSSSLAFHAATMNAGLVSAWCNGACSPCYCTCLGSTIGGSAVIYAPAQAILVLNASAWGSLYTTIVANAALSGYGVVLING